ncbi:MAG: hypothetical protein IPI49_23070 [Myxococcales bacterium]|nr:hypothetical protein [Myxococcales bacterium]
MTDRATDRVADRVAARLPAWHPALAQLPTGRNPVQTTNPAMMKTARTLRRMA